MKHLKLKVLLYLSIIAFLGSCKVDESIIGNSPNAVAANSTSEFAKNQYYHDGKLLTDTVQIQNLAKNAKVIYVDSNRVTIFDTEAKYKESVVGLKSARVSANPEESKYMIYHFSAYFKSGSDYLRTIVSVLGPVPSYNNDNVRTGKIINYTTKAGGDYSATLKAICGTRPNTALTFALSVHNPTRYLKLLTLYISDGTTYYVSMPPRNTTVFTANSGYTHVNGLATKGNIIGHTAKTI